MAIYRVGSAAMSASGVITGTGTKWQTALSLVRVGSTIMFLRDELHLATISAIVSETEMRATDTDGVAVPDGEYAILLSDSLTVDGLAQDVAETLKYYQSHETEAAGIADKVEEYLKQAQSSAAAADASSKAASSSATEASNQVQLATEQVEAAKAQVTAATEQAHAAGESASKAAISAQYAASSAQDASTSAAGASSSATKALTSENNAKTSETNAKTSETNAKNSADSISGALSNYMPKSGGVFSGAVEVRGFRLNLSNGNRTKVFGLSVGDAGNLDFASSGGGAINFAGIGQINSGEIKFSDASSARGTLLNTGVARKNNGILIPVSESQGFMVQSESEVVQLNISGEATINIPNAFSSPPNVVMTNGDGAVGSVMLSVINGIRSGSFDLRVRNPDGSAKVGAFRINYIATGLVNI